MTPFKKTIPSKGNVIGKNHVNTAYTTSCVANGSIVVYRKEEWFKVLIHECLHVLGLDFSSNSNTNITRDIKEFIPINSDVKLFEAYTEAWAEILNCMFVSYYRTKSLHTFIKKTKECFLTETLFTLFQMVKVLNHMSLDYTDLYSKDELSQTKRLYLYKEDSNVFSYYIATAILLFNVEDFILWCNLNNSNLLRYAYSPVTNRSFVDFIRKRYNSKNFLNAVSCFKTLSYNNTNNNTNNSEELYGTMRMTVVDLLEN